LKSYKHENKVRDPSRNEGPKTEFTSVDGPKTHDDTHRHV